MTLLTMNTSCDGHYFKTKNGYRVQILQYEHRVARLPVWARMDLARSVRHAKAGDRL